MSRESQRQRGNEKLREMNAKSRQLALDKRVASMRAHRAEKQSALADALTVESQRERRALEKEWEADTAQRAEAAKLRKAKQDRFLASIKQRTASGARYAGLGLKGLSNLSVAATRGLSKNLNKIPPYRGNVFESGASNVARPPKALRRTEPEISVGEAIFGKPPSKGSGKDDFGIF